jgi:hypothetical protein
MTTFRKASDYKGAVAQMVPVVAIENVQPKGSTFTWDCVGCTDTKATVLHRGTAYCRACYDTRNYNNTLVN